MAKYTIEIKNNTITNITPITEKMTRNEAIKVLEDYVGDHIAIIGGGKSMSENQKAELRHYAKVLAPIEDEDDEWDEYEYCEDECDCDCCDCECDKDTLDSLAARMILRIREILGE